MSRPSSLPVISMFLKGKGLHESLMWYEKQATRKEPISNHHRKTNKSEYTDTFRLR